MRSLASFQNVHAGGKIVVCGCGVSMRDFERPERFVTIGVNDVGRLFQPTYLLVVDPGKSFKGDRFHYIETSQAKYLFTHLTDLNVPHPNIVHFRLGKRNAVDFDDPNVIHYTVVTPYMALYLAAQMGAATIGMIGVDFTDHHFFADTGPHTWSPHVAGLDGQFRRLGDALWNRGIRVFNLSKVSRLTAFPKLSVETFAALPDGGGRPASPVRLVSYATTPIAGVPAILSRSVNARTGHYCRCVWSGGSYANGIVHDGDIDWSSSPAPATAELEAADVVMVHNGKIDPKHRRVLQGKPVLTVAHNYLWNVDKRLIEAGYPAVVTGQYAPLPEFRGWRAVPNPIPIWEEAYQPGCKDGIPTICYVPPSRYEQLPPDHKFHWHSKGYGATMSILESLEARYPIRLLVAREGQVSHAEALEMKRQAHIVIDECVTGIYHRTSLEGLAAGCVVVNGVGLLAGVTEAISRCVGQPVKNPFTFASLETLEQVLEKLIEGGVGELAKRGAANRRWMERHWDFAAQWERAWQPAIDRAREAHSARRNATVPTSQSPSLSLVLINLNEGEYLRRTVENLSASLPEDGEIIVVDDGSTDGSADLLKPDGDRLKVLRQRKRLGIASARNLGARHARGKVLVFSDAHVAAPPQWTGPLLHALLDPDVGAVNPAIRAMRYPGDYLSPKRSTNNGNGEATGYGLGWSDAGLSCEWLACKGPKPYPVPLLGGGFLAMRRSVFAATGGFDTGLVVYGSEDAELSLRLWTLGYECLVVPEVEVAHLFRGEIPYEVDWEPVLYNKLRLAAIHFSPERRGGNAKPEGQRRVPGRRRTFEIERCGSAPQAVASASPV